MQSSKEEIKRAAYSGEDIDIDKLYAPELMLYITMLNVYAMYREGRITPETAKKYTRKIEKEYDVIKSDMAIVDQELRRKANCEMLQIKYTKNPNKENALALLAEAFPSLAYRKEEYKRAEEKSVWDGDGQGCFSS